MGDLARGDACDKFIEEFNEDAVRVYGLKLGPDVTIEQRLEVPLGWMDVHFYAELTHNGETWTVMLPDVLFSPGWSDEERLENTAENFLLEDADVRRRLQKAGLLEVCPGWLITENGDIEPCRVCNPKGTVEQAYEQAATWARGLPRHPQHQDHEECSACCGFDAFACHGSSTQGDHAILRNDTCGVYDDDSVAQGAARSLYAQRWTPCAAPDVSFHRAGSAQEAVPGGDRR